MKYCLKVKISNAIIKLLKNVTAVIFRLFGVEARDRKQFDLKTRNTLEYIKANPGCDTKSSRLDGHIVEYLHNKGFINGTKTR